MENTFQIQTRSEETGLAYWPSLKVALARASEDASIWKVSFSLPNGEQVRMTRETSKPEPRWVYDPIIIPEYPSK